MGEAHYESRKERYRGNQEMHSNSRGGKCGSTEQAVKWNAKY